MSLYNMNMFWAVANQKVIHNFQRWRPPPSWIFKFWKFNGRQRSRGTNCVTVLKAAAAILDFQNLKLLTVEQLQRAELRRHAKFGRSRSKRGRDMVIFRLFKIAAAAILDFSNLKFLTVGWLQRAELRWYAKFGQNRSNRGRDMVIFRFFKMAAAAMLDFSNFKFLTDERLKRAELHFYKCISTRDNENAITYNRGFSRSTSPKKTFLIAKV